MIIWIVEDDTRTREYLTKIFAERGNIVEALASLKELSAYIEASSPETKPNLIILDRMLGSYDSADMLRLLHKTFPQAGKLILSALSDPSERARLIKEGADDYLSKPFSLEELLARAEAITRRTVFSNAASQSIFQYRDLEIDLETQKVTHNAKRLDFTQKELRLLVLLVSKPGRVHSRLQLLDKCWNTQFDVESNVVESAIKHLRKKLQDAGSCVKILNERGVGYWVED